MFVLVLAHPGTLRQTVAKWLLLLVVVVLLYADGHYYECTDMSFELS